MMCPCTRAVLIGRRRVSRLLVVEHRFQPGNRRLRAELDGVPPAQLLELFLRQPGEPGEIRIARAARATRVVLWIPRLHVAVKHVPHLLDLHRDDDFLFVTQSQG